jgi:penicillin amidase
MGSFLSPQQGFWQNAEPVDQSFDQDLNISGLKNGVEVYLDERLVPHIFAEDENDAYFVQGYIHAKFRLWQMEFQTHAAAGRLSELVGSKALRFDRNQRRMGMVFAAENALAEMEKDPSTKSALDAYTAGINTYIKSLEKSSIPIEYKILGYEPEYWTNLKSALFTKQMTQNLAGFDNDLEMTQAFHLLGEEKFRILYDNYPDSLYPIISSNTPYTKISETPKIPASADSLYFKRYDSITTAEEFKPDPSNGSNNWVLSGAKTKSGKPILANDPHLGLSLPSIWFEVQINTPAYNSYGVSFPGLPGVVIGFNDSIAFGFTNAGRDVKDYFEIMFKDKSKSEYFFNGEWVTAKKRREIFKIKDSLPFYDTVSYTVFGPVTYDNNFDQHLSPSKAISLRWVAHDSSNILKMWLQLNHAKNYNDYLEAIKHFNVPGQNMIFASRTGDIALWQQANFPLRWKDQGLMIMPGTDSSYMWNGYIPMEANPHSINPSEGFLSSANQRPVDSTYPYYIPGKYEVYRPITINRFLSKNEQMDVNDMMKLQNNNYNVFAERAVPLLLKYIDRSVLSEKETYYLSLVENWNFNNDPNEKGVISFISWWDSLETNIFYDDLTIGTNKMPIPDQHVLLDALEKDSSFILVDDIRTDEKEQIVVQVTKALQSASLSLAKIEAEGKLEWGKYKNTTVYHLLKNNLLPFARSGLMTGGGEGIVNATKHDHGPSWRMIVHMNTPIEAYGVYPGGQSGNPGSKFYDNFIDQWTRGQYYKLFVMDRTAVAEKKYKWKMTFKAA